MFVDRGLLRHVYILSPHRGYDWMCVRYTGGCNPVYDLAAPTGVGWMCVRIPWAAPTSVFCRPYRARLNVSAYTGVYIPPPWGLCWICVCYTGGCTPIYYLIAPPGLIFSCDFGAAGE